MKRFIVGTLISIILLLSYVASAERSSLGIATCYIKWLNVYNVSISSVPYFTPEVDENNNKTLFIDDLAVSYNNSTFVSDRITLFYIDNETMAKEIIDKWTRASAFFGALEYGDPESLSVKEIINARHEISEILSEMNKAMFDFGRIKENHTIPFHKGKDSRLYYLTYLQNDQQWIIELK